MDRHFSKYRDVGYLLSAIIPHAVVNKHVTGYLGRKQWLRVVSHLSDDDPWAARAVAEAIDIRPIRRSLDPFSAARMASITDFLTDGGITAAAFAMCTVARLRLFLEGASASTTTVGYEAALDTAERELLAQPLSLTSRRSEILTSLPVDPAFLEEVDAEGVATAVVRAAVAWLRDGPSRRPIDLPSFNASTIVLGKLRSDTPAAQELLTLIAPACHRVTCRAQHPNSLDLVLCLPHVAEIMLSQHDAKLEQQLLSAHPTFPTFARQVTRVQCGGGGLFHNSEGGPMFPSLTSVSLHGCSAEMERWGVLTTLPALTELVATERGEFPGDAETITNVSEREEAIARALSAVGRRLRTLQFDSSWATFSLTEPRVLDAVWKHCGNLTALSLEPVSGASPDIFRCISTLRELRSLTLGEFALDDSAKDEGENVLRDLTALPVALSKLEVLTQRSWWCVLPFQFVEALARSQTLTEWHVKSTEIARPRAGQERAEGAVFLPFPTLQRATLPCVSVVGCVSRGPSLAHVTLNESPSSSVAREALSLARFPAGANVQVVVSLRLPLTVSACALHDSGVTSLSGQLALDAVMETQVDGALLNGGLPVTLRALTVAAARPAKSPRVDRSPLGAKDLEELLRAARRTTPDGSLLEELTFIHPPDIDVVRELCGGGFPQLRRITVTGAAGRWASSAQDLGSVCSDVVVDTSTDPRAQARGVISRQSRLSDEASKRRRPH